MVTRCLITLENNINNMAINWPARFDLGISQQVTENVTLMASANWQSWSDYDANYDDTFGFGLAAQYQMGSWLLQTGMGIDSSSVTSRNNPFDNSSQGK